MSLLAFWEVPRFIAQGLVDLLKMQREGVVDSRGNALGMQVFLCLIAVRFTFF